MTRIFFDGHDVQIRIVDDGVEHAFPLAAIAAALRIDTAHLRARIDALLRAREHLSTEEARTGPSRSSAPAGMLSGEPTEGTVPIRSGNVLKEYSWNDTDIGAVSVSGVRLRDLTPEGLAEQLGDVPNTAAIAVLVRDIPLPVIERALDQALAVPEIKLRTNRAALFTVIVRRMHRAEPQPSTHYARTSTSST